MVNVKSHIAVVKDLHGNVIKSSTNLTIEAYESQRASLVQAEKAQRFDAEKLTRLTDAERLANAIVQQMKDEEDALIYSNPADDAAIKGMDWVGAKERGADKGALYRLVGQVSKGKLSTSEDLLSTISIRCRKELHCIVIWMLLSMLNGS